MSSNSISIYLLVIGDFSLFLVQILFQNHQIFVCIVTTLFSLRTQLLGLVRISKVKAVKTNISQNYALSTTNWLFHFCKESISTLVKICYSRKGCKHSSFGTLQHTHVTLIPRIVEHVPVSAQVAYECVSLCFHPFGVALAAGSTEGHLVVLNAESGAIVSTVRVCGSPLSCLGYNPGTVSSGSVIQYR